MRFEDGVSALSWTTNSHCSTRFCLWSYSHVPVENGSEVVQVNGQMNMLP